MVRQFPIVTHLLYSLLRHGTICCLSLSLSLVPFCISLTPQYEEDSPTISISQSIRLGSRPSDLSGGVMRGVASALMDYLGFSQRTITFLRNHFSEFIWSVSVQKKSGKAIRIAFRHW